MPKIVPLKDWNADCNEHKFRLKKDVPATVPDFILENLKTEGVIKDIPRKEK